MHPLSGGQAPPKSFSAARIKTVDDADGSRENSNCALMDRFWNSGIPRGQEKIFSWFLLNGVQWV
jgi:hypothetical protein